MTVRFFPLRVLALMALLLAAVPRALAEPIPWSYSGGVVSTGPSLVFDPTTHQYVYDPKILNSGGGIGPDGKPGGTDGGGLVRFADVTGQGMGSTSVTAFQMQSEHYNFSKGTFSKDLHTFTLGVSLTDAASGAKGSVSFSGNLNGYMQGGMFPPPAGTSGTILQVGFTGALQKSLVLGNHLYQVSVSPYSFQYFQVISDPMKPTISPYQNVPINVAVSDVSEPSALALVTAGLAGLGLRVWRRRRRAVEAV
jgi:hypothetical protein